MPTIPNTKYLRRTGAAAFLTEQGVETTAQGLADKLYRGVGPKCVRINGAILYTREWLLAWIEQEAAKPVKRRSTRDASAAAP
jgi:hypothetical protein